MGLAEITSGLPRRHNRVVSFEAARVRESAGIFDNLFRNTGRQRNYRCPDRFDIGHGLGHEVFITGIVIGRFVDSLIGLFPTFVVRKSTQLTDV